MKKKNIVYLFVFFLLFVFFVFYWQIIREKEKIHDFMVLYESTSRLDDLRNFVALNKSLDYNALIMRHFPDWNPCIKDVEKFKWIFSKVVSPNIRVSRLPLQSVIQSYLHSCQNQNISNGKELGLVKELYEFSSRSPMQKKHKRSQVALLYFNISI